MMTIYRGYDNDEIKFEIEFDKLYKHAIEGKTSGPVHYDRGNELIKMQRRYTQVDMYETHIDISSLPWSLHVSWAKQIPAARELFVQKILDERTIGPYDIEMIVHPPYHSAHTPAYKKSMLFAATLAYEFCKVRLKVPYNIENPLELIRDIDDCTSFVFFGNRNVVPTWSDTFNSRGYYFYISDVRIATMLRITHGIEYELTDSET